MKAIFLDIDGVLNTPSSESRCGEYIGIDDEKVEKLKIIVEKTKAEIVLISTWKKYWRKEEKLKPLQDYSANYLDEKLAKQGLKASDKTKDKSDGRYLSRGESILEYVYRNNVENYIILDDCQYDYDGCGITDKFVKTSQIEGITEEQVKSACEILLRSKKSASTRIGMIFIDDENPNYQSIDGVLYSKDGESLVRYPLGKNDLESFTVPDGVTDICERAFEDCSLLKEVIISDDVRFIGANAFKQCGLKEVKFPSAYNWVLTSYIDETPRHIGWFSADFLKKEKIAAKYLCKKYCKYMWTPASEIPDDPEIKNLETIKKRGK